MLIANGGFALTIRLVKPFPLLTYFGYSDANVELDGKIIPEFVLPRLVEVCAFCHNCGLFFTYSTI